MSRPPTFTPPPCARARVLRTERGDFAVLDAAPPAGAHSTALLLPGYTGSKEDFIALLEPLADAGFRVLAVDGRGQYETEGRDRQNAYAQAELARDVLAQAAAVDEVPPPGGIHLLGHSLGGQIARAAVLLDAAPFRSLTLMSSGPAEIDPAPAEEGPAAQRRPGPLEHGRGLADDAGDGPARGRGHRATARICADAGCATTRRS